MPGRGNWMGPYPTVKTADQTKPRSVKAALTARRKGPALREDSAAALILEAALEAFSHHGFDGVSIANIAAAANSTGVSAPLIHYYFKNKEELWKAAISFGLGDVLTEFHELMIDIEGLATPAKLRFFIKRYIGLMADRPSVFRIIIRESENTGPRFDWLVDTYLNRFTGMMVEMVEAAQVRGDIKSIVPAYHVCQIIGGACYHFIGSQLRMKQIYGVSVLSPEARKQHIDAVSDILLGGLLVSSPDPGH
jgi:TetR/AcrR family transcriptional regulator